MSDLLESDNEVTTSLADYIKPYAQTGLAGAGTLYASGGPEFYPDATYVPFAMQTERGLGMLENRGTEGYTPRLSPQETSYGTLLDDTLQGTYLSPTSNPYLKEMYEQASGDLTDTFTNTILPSLSAQFGRAGGANSQLQAQLATDAAGKLSDSLAKLQTGLYGQNYAQERGRQMQASQLVPQFSGLERQNIADQFRVGQAVEDKSREILQDEINRFNYYQTRPETNLQNYLRNISFNFPSQQTLPTSGLATTLGSAATLGSLFNEFAGDDSDGTAGYIGTGLGALLGLLGS